MAAKIRSHTPETETAVSKKTLGPAMAVSLPSGGRPYGHDVGVSIRPLSVKEIKYLDALVTEPYEASLTILLNTVLVESPVPAEELTIGDREFLLLWIRENTYSDTYLADWICPACGHQYVSYGFDLSKVPIVELEPVYEEPMRVRLTDGSEIEVCLPRGMDITDEDDWSNVCAKCVADAESFLNYPASDRFIISSVIDLHFHGPNYAAYPVKCTAGVPEGKKKQRKCGWEGPIRLPFRREFFSPVELYRVSARNAIIPRGDE